MYIDTLNGSDRISELPDAVGPNVQLQEKLYVPTKEHPDVSVCTFVHVCVCMCVRACVFHSHVSPLFVSLTSSGGFWVLVV